MKDVNPFINHTEFISFLNELAYPGFKKLEEEKAGLDKELYQNTFQNK
mgnify:CR=1 FL=1